MAQTGSPPNSRIHAMVMAGGTGSRLQPLTGSRCKPALPFGTEHRVVDFVLANLRNSGIRSATVMVQYQRQSLVAHLQRNWCVDGRFDVRIATPVDGEFQDGAASRAYCGTADAVYQNLHLPQVRSADLVAVFGADHIYRMDVGQMADAHVRAAADVTVAALPVPLQQAAQFGIVETAAGSSVCAFHEKPARPRAMPDRPSHALASMGNYIFSRPVLEQVLAEAHAAGETDFGLHVLPRVLGRWQLHAYDFAGNTVPGVDAHDEPGYWRDVGTIDAYFEAQMDTLGSAPRFALDDRHWPLAPRRRPSQPALVLRGQTRASRLGHAALVDRATLEQVVVGDGAKVLPGARLQRCVLFGGVVVGRRARLRNVIVDEGNTIPDGETIGFDPAADSRRFPVSADGVTVVPRGHFGAGAVRAGQPHAARG